MAGVDYARPVRRLNSWEDLRLLVGTTSEAADLDFKEALNPEDERVRIECAKDVAALANTLGGHILVGASTELNRTRCTGFHGIEKSLASLVTEVFEKQARDRCRPTPLLSARLFDLPGSSRVVVMVAVEPSPVAPIGISLRQTGGGHLTDEGWAFPYRVASQTAFLRPDQLGVFDSMTARRSAALLSNIPSDQRECVRLRWIVDNPPHSGTAHQFTFRDVKFESLDLGENVARFRDRGDGAVVICVPLDDIASVWRGVGAPAPWQVSLRGTLRSDGPRWDYWAAR